MDVDTKTLELIVDAVREVHDQSNKKFDALIQHINKNIDYTAKRFDDIDKRLSVLELKMTQSSHDTHEQLRTMSKDTGLLPDMFTMLEQDGVDIAKLKQNNRGIAKLEQRIRKLEV